MVKSTLSLDQAIEFLNSLVEIDAKALANLIETRVACTTKLTAHPSVQVQIKSGDNRDADSIPKDQQIWQIGFLGVLNGLFGTISDGDKKGWGPIAAVFESDGTLSGFRRTDDPAVKPVFPRQKE